MYAVFEVGRLQGGALLGKVVDSGFLGRIGGAEEDMAGVFLDLDVLMMPWSGGGGNCMGIRHTAVIWWQGTSLFHFEKQQQQQQQHPFLADRSSAIMKYHRRLRRTRMFSGKRSWHEELPIREHAMDDE